MINFIKNIASELLKGNFSALSYFQYFSKRNESLLPNHNSVTDRQPWITYPAIHLLTSKLNPQSKVFEYGGGGSTLFFLDHASTVITVEHNKDWFQILDKMIEGNDRQRWEGHFIAAGSDELTDSNPSDPLQYRSADPTYIHANFKAYASAIDAYPDGYFDVVLVDGRARPSCLYHAVPKLKKDGWLVVDNSDRSYYFTQLETIFKDHFTMYYNKKAPSPYANFFTQTGIWVKKD